MNGFVDQNKWKKLYHIDAAVILCMDTMMLTF